MKAVCPYLLIETEFYAKSSARLYAEIQVYFASGGWYDETWNEPVAEDDTEGSEMFPWNRKEVLVTNDARRFGHGMDALRDAGIKFETRAVNTGGGSHRRGVIGSFGEDMRLSILYYIYVKKGDSEQAEYLIGSAAKG
ncbi:hypothetical protein SDC9_131422 [bioreactor metagenome]|uniref:Uncharacterized protein n=1 Tax=bioreactor metagenome TaxID=1076179 RepID=A0A645D554_9ZZZZ